MKPELSVKLGKVELKNPLMTASGTCGYGEELSGYFDVGMIGAIVTKSLTLKPKIGNEPPRVAEVSSGMLNSIGLANIGVRRFIEEKLPLLEKLNALVIANIAAKRAEDYAELAELLAGKESVRAVELNLSCPNVKEGGMEFGTDVKALSTIVKMVRKVFGRTIIVKLTPNVTRISDFARAAEAEGADAVTVANTYVGMAIDIYTRRPKLHTVRGGLSGPAIRPLTMAKVFEVSKSVQIPVVASGGVFAWQDVVEYIIAGATAVEIGTVLFAKPDAPVEMVKGISEYLADSHFGSIAELRGSLDVNLQNVPHMNRG